MYNTLLLQDYFVDGCTYTDEQFRRRFCMRRPLFLRILDAVVDHNEYFAQQYDACSVPGMLPHQKICALHSYTCNRIVCGFLGQQILHGQINFVGVVEIILQCID